MGVFIGLGTVVPATLLMLLFLKLSSTAPGMSPLQTEQAADKQVLGVYAQMFLGAFLAPVFEEVFFRGFLAEQLKKSMSMPLSLLLSSAVFSLGHGLLLDDLFLFMLTNFIPVMIIGLILGAAYFKYGLTASIVAHSVFNLKAYYMPHLQYAVLLLIPAGIAVLFLLFLPKYHRSLYEH